MTFPENIVRLVRKYERALAAYDIAVELGTVGLLKEETAVVNAEYNLAQAVMKLVHKSKVKS